MNKNKTAIKIIIAFTCIFSISIFTFNILSSKTAAKTENNISNKQNYLGYWEDLYSQRANLEISDLGNHIKAEVNWSSSAVENTKWIYECKYDEKYGSLSCQNGKEILETESGQKTIKNNLTVTINLTKGSLKTTLDNLDGYFGDKEEELKTRQDMTLKINNNEDLASCIFVK